MIIKGNQRSGGRQLAHHLLKDDNEHVEVHQIHGFMADDLHGAFAEAHAIAKATDCTQFLFSLSLNPPQDEAVPIDVFEDAADRVEKRLGLENQPRAIVFHEKEGRRHAHVVWSRIDSESMTAINLSWYKNKLNSLAKELFLEHGWELPHGFRDPMLKDPLNFTHAELQQALRAERDPREIKQAIQSAWANSDCAKSLSAALQEYGFKLARGDRRGFVLVDYKGEVYSLSRWAGLKAKQLKQRLGDPEDLPSVDQAKEQFRKALKPRLKDMLNEMRQKHKEELAPLLKQKRQMARQHKLERQHLKAKQAKRWQQETKTRQARLHKGLRGLWDWLSGRAKQVRRQNEQEAWVAYKRDQNERDGLIVRQLEQRQALQRKIVHIKGQQSEEKHELNRNVDTVFKLKQRKYRLAETSQLQPIQKNQSNSRGLSR